MNYQYLELMNLAKCLDLLNEIACRNINENSMTINKFAMKISYEIDNVLNAKLEAAK